MAERYLTCPLCGFEFQRADSLCKHGCPLGAACNLARCPQCEYEFPERLPGTSWLRRLFRKEDGAAPPAPAESLLTVKDLAGGEHAEVLCLGGDSPSRRNHLAVFGLVPGSAIRLLQRYPSFVIEIGETVLALDVDVAGDIVVKRGAVAAM
ncbi:MAG TPA: FeoA family protein [Thermoanaerobaculia bacterium]|nr:FeoA family protein [Thermoanaerobaculia bacterium]